MIQIFKIGELGVYTIDKYLNIAENMDFTPEYQRVSNIWDRYKKQLFIDSIINGFDIPKFYLHYFIQTGNPLNKSDKLYAIIDGKQRLEAIRDFVNNKFPLSSEFQYYKDQSIDLSNLFCKDIIQKFPIIISQFYNTELDFVFISTDDENFLEEMFLRLNGGEVLTNAEKRNAIGGFLTNQIRDIVSNHLFFTKKVKFKNVRFQFQDLCTKLLFLQHNKKLISLNNKNLNEFIKQNKKRNGRNEGLISEFYDTLEFMINCFDDNDSLLKSKSIVPVYYYFIYKMKPDPQLFRRFLKDFEVARLENRQKSDEDTQALLVEFDRLNQQGVHTKNSLTRRYKILNTLFKAYRISNHIDTSVLSMKVLENDEILEEMLD